MIQTQTNTERGIVTKAAFVCILVVALHLFVSPVAAGGAPTPDPTVAPDPLNVTLADDPNPSTATANATWAIDFDAGTVNVTNGTAQNERVASISPPVNTTKVIQFAVSNATATNDSVIIGGGIYNGTLDITDPEASAINGSGPVGEDVVIDGYGGSEAIYLDSPGTSVFGFSNLSNASQGVEIGPTNVSFTQNTISDAYGPITGQGIQLTNTGDTELSGNDILLPSSSANGISIGGGGTPRNLTISGMNINDTENGIIASTGVENVTVDDLIIDNTTVAGIDMSSGAPGSVVRDNKITNTGFSSISISGENVTIQNNTLLNTVTDFAGVESIYVSSVGGVVSENKVDGVALGKGITVRQNETVENNNVNNTSTNGIEVTSLSTEGANIINNTVTNTTENGTLIEGDNAVLKGNNISDTTGDGVFVNAASGTELINNNMTAVSSGVFGTGVSGLTVSDGLIENVDSQGIRTESSSDNVTVDGVRINDTSGSVGVSLSSTQDTLVRNSTVRNSLGIRVASPNLNGTVRNNTLLDTTGDAIYGGTLVEDNEVDGTTSGGAGIFIPITSTVRNNTVNGTTGNGIESNVANPDIINNTVTESGLNGIELPSADGATVRDNTVEEISSTGIDVSGPNNVLENNTLRNITSVGIFVTGINNSLSESTIISTNDTAISATSTNTLELSNTTVREGGRLGKWALELTSAGVEATNFDIGPSTNPNTTLNFTAEDVALTNVSSPRSDPTAQQQNISRYVNATNTSSSSYFNVTFQYEDSDIPGGASDSSLSIWKDNGSWTELGVDSLDKTANTVQYNVTNVGSDFAPFVDVTTVGGCTDITSSGVYTLSNDITNATASSCIDIEASDVIFDGGNNYIDGVDNTTNSVGINVSASSTLTNVTVRNVNLTGWGDTSGVSGAAIEVSDTDASGEVNVISDVNITRTGLGIDVSPDTNPTTGVNITDSVITNTGDNAVTMGDTPQVNVTNSTFRNSGAALARIGGTGNLTFVNNTFGPTGADGVVLFPASDDEVTFRNDTFVDVSGPDIDDRQPVGPSGTNVTFSNTTTGVTSTVDFDVGGINTIDAPNAVPSDPPNDANVNEYLNVTEDSFASSPYLNVTFDYDPANVPGSADENTLAVKKYNGTWNDEYGVTYSNLDTTAEEVTVNATEVGSTFAPTAFEEYNEVDSCVTIDASNAPSDGVVNVTSDINTSLNSCINITVSDITLKGQNNTINGTDAFESSGVNVTNSSTTLTNVNVTNVTTSNWYTGVLLDNASESMVNDSLFVDNRAIDINLKSTDNSTVRSNEMRGDANSVDVDISDDNVIEDNLIIGGGGFNQPIFFDAGPQSSNVVRNNTMRGRATDMLGINIAERTNDTLVVNNTLNGTQREAISAGGFGADVTDSLRVINNNFTNVTGGMELRGVTNSVVRDNNVTSSGSTIGDGVIVSDSSNLTVTDNGVIGFRFGVGISAETSQDVGFVRNEIDTTREAGIRLSSGSDYNVSHNTITYASQSAGFSSPGIYVGANSTEVINNTVANTGASASGILVEADDNVLRRNDISNANQNGTAINSATNVTLENNNITTTTNGDGVYLYNSPDVNVTGGKIVGTGGYGVNDNRQSGSLLVENVNITNVGATGIRSLSSGALLRDNLISNPSGRAIIATGGGNITNNTLDDEIRSTGSYNITENDIDGASTAIQVSGSGIVAADNVINNTGNDPAVLIGTSSGGSSIDVLNNTVTNATGSGFNLTQYSSDITLEENEFRNVTGDAISVNASTGHVINNTTVRNIGGRAFRATDDGRAAVNGLNLGNSTANNTIVDFIAQDAAVSATPGANIPADRFNERNISRYVNATGTTGGGDFLTLTYRYNDSDVAGLSETAIDVWRYDGTWTEEGGTVDPANNTVTFTKNFAGGTTVYAPLANLSAVDSCRTIEKANKPENDYAFLSRDIVDSTAPSCMNITVSNVTFDGQDNLIDSDGSGDIGVNVTNTTTVENVTVRDVRATDWGDGGITYDGVNESEIIDINVTDNTDDGIELNNSHNVTVRDSDVSGNDYGIYLKGVSSDNTIMNNTANDNRFNGLLGGSSSTFAGNIVLRNGVNAISVDDNNSIINNTVINNYGNGVDIDDDNILTNNTAYDNSPWDLNADENNTVENLNVGASTASDTTVDLDVQDARVKGNSTPPKSPPGLTDIGRYIEAEQDGPDAYMNVTFQYSGSDVRDVRESTLSVWKNNGTWTDLGVDNLDTNAGEIRYNVTNFGSVFAPLGQRDTGGGGANRLPDASFDVSDDPTAGETVTLNASASDDPDGTVTEYNWKVDGSTLSEDGEVVEYTFAESGFHEIGLTVRDSENAKDSTETVVNVAEGDGDTATDDASDEDGEDADGGESDEGAGDSEESGGGATDEPDGFNLPSDEFTVGDEVTLEASDSLGLEGNVTGYEWTVNGEQVGTDEVVTHVLESSGEVEVTLSVSDDTGANRTFSRTISVEDVEEQMDDMDEDDETNDTQGTDEQETENVTNESDEDADGEGLPGFTALAALLATLVVIVRRRA